MSESLFVVGNIDWLAWFRNCDGVVEVRVDGAERTFEFLDIEGGIRVSIRFIGRLSLTGLAGLLCAFATLLWTI